MILLDRVTKNYGKSNKPALNRASIHVGAGEFVIIVGTSGAGKSTLLKLLTREEKPSSGKIVVGGIDYDNLKDKHIPLLRRKIGVVFRILSCFRIERCLKMWRLHWKLLE